MLRTANTQHFLENVLERKCAEIFFGKKNNFTILCTQCQLKCFDYKEFILHFNNVHLHSNLEKNEKLFPQVKEHANDMTISEDKEQRPASMERIINNSQEASDASEFESFDGNVQPSVSSEEEEEFTPIILKKNRLGKKLNVNNAKGTHVCSECNIKYSFARNLERHTLKFHNTNNYESSQCDQIHNNSNDEAHSKTYSCTYCDRAFKRKESQKYHELNHTAERNIPCDIPGCSKYFVSDARMRHHKRTVHVPKNDFVCEVCGVATKRSSDLIIHRRMHTGERPFQCDVCQKSFASNSLLNEHKPMHSTEQSHVCEICGKAFSRRKALYHHKYLHLDVKKFVCKLCGRAYAQMAGLAAHMRQHRQQDMCLD